MAFRGPDNVRAQTDVAKTSGQVSVATSSTAVAAANDDRVEITVTNDGANVVYLAFSTTRGTAPTATANNGVRLTATGGSWTSRSYTGAIAGIALTGATVVTVTEF